MWSVGDDFGLMCAESASVSTFVHCSLKLKGIILYADRPTEEGRGLVILCLRVIKYRPSVFLG